ncbi:MAG TPA: formyltransferase family protein [Pyrinomonadaceae bacterium]|jgi:folate-dependent phosphoribosylglycinamide formyltransferase PurN
MMEKGSDKKFRVILLTHGGAELVLERLLGVEGVEVAGVFVETETTPRRGWREKLRRSIRYDGWAATASKLAGQLLGRRAVADAAGAGRDALREMCAAAGVPFQLVANYHTEEAAELMRAARADLGVIYGTNIIRESVFRIPRLGSINLHQGLAPLYRGGPPVFWELYNGEREVGLTVHFVEAKVDTGAVLVQETVPLAYDDARGDDFEAFIEEYTSRLRARSAELVARAVRLIAEGTYDARPQDTSRGKRYRLPTKREKDELRRRLRARRREAGTAAEGRAADAEGR